MNKFPIGLRASVLLLASALTIQAQDRTWQGATGSWDVPGNWTPSGAPNQFQNATINNSGTATVGVGVTATARAVRIGFGGGSLLVNGGILTGNFSTFLGTDGMGSALVTSGTWNSSEIFVGYGSSVGAGSLVISGGVVNSATGYLAFDAGTTGSATVSGGQWNTSELQIGTYGSLGTLSVNGGTVSNSGIGYIAYGAAATGIATVTSGTWTNAYDLYVGYNGNGTLQLNGGVLEARRVIGKADPGAVSTFSFNGGTLRANSDQTDFVSGFTSEVTIGTGGAFMDSNGFDIGTGSVFTGSGALTKLGLGTLTLTGANTYLGGTTVTAGLINFAAGNNFGTGNITLNGGGLQWATGNTLDISNRLNAFGAGGAFFDTNENDVTLASALSGAGRLTKLGSGTLTLTGSNTYGGGTTVRNGTLAIGTGGAILHSGANLTVGRNSGDVASMIMNSGTVSNAIGYVGELAGSQATATINGGSWINSTALVVGYEGTGTLTQTGGLISSQNTYIGYNATGTGTVTLTGGTLANSNVMIVGTSGQGTLLINGGLVTDIIGFIGYNSTGSGSATVSSGTWSNSLGLFVGDSGKGSLLVNGGLVTNTSGDIGYIGSGSATVSSGTWANSVTLFVGRSGTGTLNLTDTGFVSVGAGSGTVTVGQNAGAVGTLNIGTGGAAGRLLAGVVNGGTGTAVVNFNHTGSHLFAPRLTGSLSVNKLGSGTTVLTGSNTYSGSTTISNGTLAVTSGGSINHASGAMTVGDTAGDQGSLLINGGRITNGRGILGNAATASGTATVSSGTWNNGDLYVGASGTGHLLIGSSGYVSGEDVRIGLGVGSNGIVTVSGGTLAINLAGAVGSSGTGVLNVTDNGLVTVEPTLGLLHLGLFNGSSGTLNIGTGGVAGRVETQAVVGGMGGSAVNFNHTGSITFATPLVGSLDVTKLGAGTTVLTGSNTYSGSTTIRDGTLAVNSGGRINHGSAQMNVGTVSGQTGTLAIGAGGSVTNHRANVGSGGTGVVTVSGSGATWTNTEDLNVGLSSTGSLAITDGGSVSADVLYVGLYSGIQGTVTVSGSGSQLSARQAFVASSGTGVMNLVDGGMLTLNSGTGGLGLARSNGSTGILNIGTGGLAGILNASRITTDSFYTTNIGIVNFNHTDAITFGTLITGRTSVNKLASGTTTFTGSNTYTGGTTITGGKLVVNGVNSGTGAVSVASGAALAGSGTIAGVVTVADGGILSPGTSPGTLTVGGMILNATSDLQFELGTTSDLVVVLNDLTLDGILNVTDSGGFGLGSYTLFQYSGALTNNGLAIGTMPAGFIYTLDLSQAGYVRLTVVPPDLYWDGPNTTPDGTVSGGSGTWNNSTTNWTTASGSSNFAWNSSGTAHFTGTAGTVDVAETINVADMIFETDGYALTGTGALAISGSTLTVNTGSGVTAGIATQITGTGALVKTGADSTLILSGSNSYIGDTLIEGGVLQVTGVVQNSSNVYVGYSNSDTSLVISNGGSVTDTSATIGVSASAQNNIATVTGSNSIWTSTGDLNVGFDGSNNILNVENGGSVSANYLKIGGGALSAGNQTSVTGTNSLLTTINDLLVGYGGTSNTLAISNGGRVVNTNGFVGHLATANGNSVTVSGPNSLWTNNGTLYLGDAGSGNSIMVSNGGTVTVNGASQDAVIGLATTSTGNKLTVTGIGSAFANASTLYVGRSGGGNGMDILSGGLVTSHNARIGGDATSNNNLVSVDGAGSLWNGGGTLRIGSAGSNNALNITNGGAVTMAGNTFIGYSTTATNNSVSVDGAGSSLSAGALIIGRDGVGNIVTVSNGGTVTSSTITLGANAGSGGILQIGNGGAAGSVNSTAVIGGAGAALVNFNHTGLTNFAPRLSGGIAVNKLGSGTTVLSGANSYTQGTAISDGVLQTTTSTALGTGAVALSAGALAPVGQLNIASLAWNGGTLAMVLGTNTSFLNIAGNLTLTGVGQFDFTGDSGFMTDTQYAILAAANLAGFSTGSFAGSTLLGVTPTFTMAGNTLLVSFLGANSGPVIQNSGPYFTPRTSDFQVNGPVRTGSPTESNTVNSLTFADGSSVAVFNNLTVTSGNFNVATGSASMTGGNVIVPGAFNLNGLGTLIAGSNFAIGGDANINGGNLVIDGLFAAGGNMNVNSTVTVNGNAAIAGSLNTNASVVTVNGEFAVGGDANLNNGTALLVNGNTSIARDLNAIASGVTVNGLFAVGGSANLNQGSNLVVNAGGLLAVGEATNINFGSTAVINGQLASPQVSVNRGLLKGAGLIAGNVWNNGTVAPGNSPGTLSIDGNYTQTGNGTLEIEPGDLLWVSGRASLAGTLQLVAAGKLKYGQQITFLQAGSISGDFDQILVPNPAKNRGRLLVDGGTGTLLIAPTSYTLVAETGNQRNVAKALDSFISARGDDREEVSIALDLQATEQYPAAFDQIAPSFYESLADITIEQTNAQNQNLAQRASALRLGARGFQAIGIEAPLVHDKDGKSVMDDKDGKNILSYGPDNKWGVWVQGNGNFARITSASQVPNYRFESGGFLAGADYRWSENFVTGLYGGYQGTLAKYNEGGRTTINSVQFGGYASYDNGGFYADAIVGGGYSAYEVRRPINFSTIDRTARSRPDGGQFTTYLDFGYDWKLGNFTVGPIVSGQYTYAGIAPFTETGADSLDLSVGQQNANSLRTSLGGRIAYTWKVSEKFTLIPEGRMFWQHEFLENPRNIGASLDGGNGPSFGYTTSTPDRDAVFAGAGLIGQFGPNWNAYFYYNADFGRQDYISHAISTGLNFKF